jgi:hypothetical protein
MLSDDEYKAYVDKLASQDLKISLLRNSTTMGPGYIFDKIAEILEAKSIVNEMSEKAEIALCDAEVRLNDLRGEIQLRTHVEYMNLDDDATGLKNAKSREAYVWTQVEQGYVSDHKEEFDLRQTQTTQFQLTEDLRIAETDVIRFKALLKIIDHRRDELGKLDSGVRLQQKTMETEAAIYGKGGIPQTQVANNGNQGNTNRHVDVGVVPREVDENDAPDAISEDFDAPPPPIEEIPY